MHHREASADRSVFADGGARVCFSFVHLASVVPVASSYPIAGYFWIALYRNQSDAEKGKALAHLLWWMVHQGRAYAKPLSYAPLPAVMVSHDERQIRELTCGSTHQSCYQGT
ncbi:hypothetical protein [Ktedonobacter sp. SOSP1-52]|uniref:hypothetical protein n=1 Tax=Ktedonobacter sp. SOSP1-52 TaxID=2778366 RepID=UPI0019150DA5|nr:hypothetical protein [Ktedonobacter sp. SOSP1-52]